MAVLKQKLGVKILSLTKTHCNKLCFLSYLAGTIYFLILAFKGYNDGTYFSENALLPGLVQGDFYDESSIHSFHAALKKESTKSRSIPANWIATEMRKVGVDAYVHDYNLTYPLGIAENDIIPGQNVYGILRASRTPSTEALVLSAPYRPPDNGVKPDNNYAIATMLGLARFFRKHSHWAKDLIFLVTDHEAIGMAAWLEAYHQTPSMHIHPAELFARGGSIQAAINLEMNSPELSSIDLKIEGLNGQLPNLDLFNLVARMCRKEAIVPTLKNLEDHYYPESKTGYLHSLKTMTRSMLSQSTGYFSGNHGLFHKYHIEALTMSSLDGAPKNARYGVLEMGRILEAIYRSLNNLLERFHQSFFFYVLPATERYVSIGVYMRPLALIVVPLIVQALSNWIAAGMMEPLPQLKKMYENFSFDLPAKDEDPKKPLDAESEEKKELQEKEPEVGPPEVVLPPIPPVNSLHILANFAYCYSVSFAIFFSFRFFLDMGRVFRIPSSTALVLGGVSLGVPVLILPILVAKAVHAASNIRAPVTSVACVVQGHSHDAAFARQLTTSTCHLLKSVSLILLSLFIFSVALVNFSLALFISVVVVPVALLSQSRHTSLGRILSASLVFLVSPPFLFLYGIALHTFVYDEPFHLVALLTAFKDGSFAALVDYHMHGVQTLPIFTLGYFPIWLLFWTLVISTPKNEIVEIDLDHQKKSN